MALSSTKKRGLIFIIAAVVCALFAIFLTFSIASRGQPDTPIVVATEDIAPGDPLTEDQFTVIEFAEVSVPPESVTPDIDLSNKVASKGLAENDILREPHMMSLEEDSPSIYSARVTALEDPDLRAIEVPVDVVGDMASGLDYGDKIDLIAVFDAQEPPLIWEYEKAEEEQEKLEELELPGIEDIDEDELSEEELEQLEEQREQLLEQQ